MFTRPLLLLGFGAVLAAPLSAQRPERTPGPERPRMAAPGIAPEAALRYRKTLQLTERQIADLSALRAEAVKARQDQALRTIDLTSRLRAGDISLDEFRMQSRVGRGAAPAPARVGERVRAVLDSTQRATLGELVREEARDRWGPRGPRMDRGLRMDRMPARRRG